MGVYAEYVENYKDETGNYVLTYPAYYEKEVTSRGGKYTNHYLDIGRMAICPLHDDHDPSLGLIKGKHGGLLAHCFGCGWTGSVSAMHRRLMSEELGRSVSEEEACRDICSKWGIPIWGDLSDSMERKYEERMRNISVKVRTSYTRKDYARELRDLRVKGDFSDAWRSYVKMVAVEKGMIS